MATVSKSVTVVDGGTYTLELNAIPNGKTVTPVNDIQTWLHCADIWNKNYTTLDQVLADAPTFQALIASNNAVDYMVRSTEWASDSNVGLVPTMTSDTTPSGEAIASGRWASDYGIYAVFDNDVSTYWQSNPGGGGTGNGTYIGYKFPSKTRVVRAIITGFGYAASGDIYYLKLQGSNDKSTWIDLSESTQCTNKSGTPVDSIVATKNINDYQYYRLIMVDTPSATAFGAYTVQFYSKSGIPTNQNAMTYIGNNNYCANQLLANSTWLNAICNSLYFESVLNVKVPTMTSDTTPLGVVSANAINWGAGGREAYKAFDGNDDSMWWGAWTNNTSWVQYVFPSNIKLSKATCYTGFGSWDHVGEQASALIEYSTDGTNWTQFGNTIVHVVPSRSEKRVWYTVTATQETCKYVRFRNLDNKAGAGAMPVWRLQFYGRA